MTDDTEDVGEFLKRMVGESNEARELADRIEQFLKEQGALARVGSFACLIVAGRHIGAICNDNTLAAMASTTAASSIYRVACKAISDRVPPTGTKH